MCVWGGWLILSHKQDDPRWYQSSDALYESLCYYRELKRWASDSAISFLLESKLSLDPSIKPCKAVPTVLTTCLYLASRYVLGNNMHVYLSLQALQLKPMSVKMRLTSVTNVFFWTQLLLGAEKKAAKQFWRGLWESSLKGWRLSELTGHLAAICGWTGLLQDVLLSRMLHLGAWRKLRPLLILWVGLISTPRMGPLIPIGFWMVLRCTHESEMVASITDVQL